MEATMYDDQARYEQEIRDAFPLRIVFEHNQHWVILGDYTFSVVMTGNGPQLEQV